MGAVNKANSRQNQKRDKRYKPYSTKGQREINKALKLMRHIRNTEKRIMAGKQENMDKQAIESLAKLPELAKSAAKKIYEKSVSAT